MIKEGLIQIYTGDGKGKSTAAFGLSLRAAGWGLHTAIVQFMKNGKNCGEIIALANNPLIDVYCFGSGQFLTKNKAPDEKNLEIAQDAMAKARELLADPSIDILILDEICNAIYFDLTTEAEVLALLNSKRSDQEVILTGQKATAALLKKADLITNMQMVKHPYQKGIDARKGIEY